MALIARIKHSFLFLAAAAMLRASHTSSLSAPGRHVAAACHAFPYAVRPSHHGAVACRSGIVESCGDADVTMACNADAAVPRSRTNRREALLAISTLAAVAAPLAGLTLPVNAVESSAGKNVRVGRWQGRAWRCGT